jgi:hypothetical protein
MNEEAQQRVVHYTLQEIEAINTIRASMLKKPEIIDRIMKDGSYAMAERVLLKARDELSQLLEVNRAFVAAASTLAKQQKESKDENRN